MTTEKGKYPMMTFTDEHMNRLFEKFILEYYKKEFPQLKAEAKQINWAIDNTISTNELLPIMQTDIMLHFKNGKTLIIDAKYYGQTMQYHFNKATIHSHNLYQIHTYVINQDKNHEGNVDGMLLYAKTEEEILSIKDTILNYKKHSEVADENINSTLAKITEILGIEL
jgi:5-methylcytosine-specific restriction enzyme subunit McrC